MIVQALLNWLCGLLAGGLDLLPNLPATVAASFTAVPAQLASVSAGIAKLGPLVPFAQLATAAAIFAAALGVAVVVYLVLKVLSLVTGGGGAA